MFLRPGTVEYGPMSNQDAEWPADPAARSPSSSTRPSVPPPPTSPPSIPPPRPSSWSVPPPPPTRRLVRDPGASLGGVASGLSQYYGIDVSVVRLAFVLFTLISGVGIVLYLLAWIIVPKGEQWPPPGARTSTAALTNRELGIGAILLGLALVIFVSGGSVGEVILPLLLIGGGIWMLNQTRPAPAPAAGPSGPGPAPAPVGSWPAPGMVGASPPPGGYQPQDTVIDGGYPAGPPPRPNRRRPLRALFIGVMALVGGFLALLVIGASAFLIFGDVGFEDTGSQTYAPTSVEEIPGEVTFDAGDLVLDLSGLDPSDFETVDEPIEVTIDASAGDIRIVVPDDLNVAVDAKANVGDITVFGDGDDGINPTLIVADPAPAISIDVDLNFGSISVERP